MTDVQTGFYIHIPFCEKKCPYCDFNTYAGLDGLYDETVDALCRELKSWSQHLKARQISTIFLGGGTPTALSIYQLDRIFETVYTNYTLTDGCEITSEVNPGAVDRAKFLGLKELGINRLSLGVQSFHESELRFLGRIHNVADVYEAYDAARLAGFDNINLDFMFGLPEQSVESWQQTLEEVIALRPDHLSLYSLIVEPNTVLNHWVQTGRASAPDEEMAATHYEMAIDKMAEAGYTHYEISNWTNHPKKACEHNLIYWRNYDYLGIGPGAHSHIRFEASEISLDMLEDGTQSDTAINPQLRTMLEEGGTGTIDGEIEFRWGNRKPVPGYIKRMHAAEPTGEFFEQPKQAVSMGETMMLGLRLLQEGVPRSRFIDFFGQDLADVYHAEIADLLAKGLIEVNEQGIYLSQAGLMIGNQVFYHFLAA